MRVVAGFDPGSRLLGYGIILDDGRKLTYLEAGVLAAPSSWPKARRLRSLSNDLVGVLADAVSFAREAPGASLELAAEDGFVRYPKSALVVGEARGLVIGIAGTMGLEVTLYPPKQVKAVLCRGDSKKIRIARAVKSILSMTRMAEPDAADALSVAICHARKTRPSPQATRGAPKRPVEPVAPPSRAVLPTPNP